MDAPTGTRTAAHAALSKLAAWFKSRPTRQGIVARRLMGIVRAEDEVLQQALRTQWQGERRDDGSVGGAVLPTIWRIQEMLDLGLDDTPEFALHCRWALTLQDQPGAYHEGCVAVRHRHKACEHYLGGFFSPAPPEVSVTPITLPTGRTFRAEPAARFALSCLILQTLLLARVRSLAMDRHLDSLALLASEFADWDGYFAPDLAASTLAALASSSRTPDAARNLTVLMGMNQVDGTWRNGDLFHFLDALLRVQDAQAVRPLQRAVPALLQRQRSDGSFGAGASEERSLIALRTLLAVTGSAGVPRRRGPLSRL